MRERIIQSTRGLIKKYGFKKFSVDDIAADLGISKKTVYKHFMNKNEIISAIVSQYIQEQYQNTDKEINEAVTTIEKLKAAIFCHTKNEFSIEELSELKKYYPEEWGKIQELYRSKKSKLYQLIELGRENGEIKKCISTDSLLLVIEKVMEGLLDSSLLEKYNKTAKQAIGDINIILLEGILEPRGRDEL